MKGKKRQERMILLLLAGILLVGYIFVFWLANNITTSKVGIDKPQETKKEEKNDDDDVDMLVIKQQTKNKDGTGLFTRTQLDVIPEVDELELSPVSLTPEAVREEKPEIIDDKTIVENFTKAFGNIQKQQSVNILPAPLSRFQTYIESPTPLSNWFEYLGDFLQSKVNPFRTNHSIYYDTLKAEFTKTINALLCTKWMEYHVNGFSSKLREPSPQYNYIYTYFEIIDPIVEWSLQSDDFAVWFDNNRTNVIDKVATLLSKSDENRQKKWYHSILSALNSNLASNIGITSTRATKLYIKSPDYSDLWRGVLVPYFINPNFEEEKEQIEKVFDFEYHEQNQQK
jgi:hypothetical protein